MNTPQGMDYARRRLAAALAEVGWAYDTLFARNSNGNMYRDDRVPVRHRVWYMLRTPDASGNVVTWTEMDRLFGVDNGTSMRVAVYRLRDQALAGRGAQEESWVGSR